MYVACIEVKILDGCEINPEEFEGAAVRCYIPASSESEARQRLLRSLEKNRFELIEIDFLVEKNSTYWENPDDPTAENLSKQALKGNKVVYGEFGAWGKE